jgi:hypothetical protein
MNLLYLAWRKSPKGLLSSWKLKRKGKERKRISEGGKEGKEKRGNEKTLGIFWGRY